MFTTLCIAFGSVLVYVFLFLGIFLFGAAQGYWHRRGPDEQRWFHNQYVVSLTCMLIMGLTFSLLCLVTGVRPPEAPLGEVPIPLEVWLVIWASMVPSLVWLLVAFSARGGNTEIVVIDVVGDRLYETERVRINLGP